MLYGGDNSRRKDKVYNSLKTLSEETKHVANRNQTGPAKCRKADWIDATKSSIHKGLSKEAVPEVEAAFPNSIFHDTLLRRAKDYGGSTLVGGVKVMLGIVKW